MTRHPTARRVHRDSAGPDDVFVAGVLESTAWAQKHAQKLIIGGIAVVIAVLILVVVLSSRSARRSNAIAQLTQVRATVLSGNNQLAIRDLEQFMASYGGTPSADEARLMLARAYLQENQVQRAIETIRDMADDVRTVVGVNAAFLLGAAHEAADESRRAEEVYLRVGERAEYMYQRQEGLDNAARVRLQRGDAAGAVQLYDQLLAMTPDTDPNKPVYELRAGEARAAATAGTAAAGTTGS